MGKEIFPKKPEAESQANPEKSDKLINQYNYHIKSPQTASDSTTPEYQTHKSIDSHFTFIYRREREKQLLLHPRGLLGKIRQKQILRQVIIDNNLHSGSE